MGGDEGIRVPPPKGSLGMPAALWLSWLGAGGWGEGNPWHLAGGDQGSCSAPHRAWDAPNHRVTQPQRSVVLRLRSPDLARETSYQLSIIYLPTYLPSIYLTIIYLLIYHQSVINVHEYICTYMYIYVHIYICMSVSLSLSSITLRCRCRNPWVADRLMSPKMPTS